MKKRVILLILTGCILFSSASCKSKINGEFLDSGSSGSSSGMFGDIPVEIDENSNIPEESDASTGENNNMTGGSNSKTTSSKKTGSGSSSSSGNSSASGDNSVSSGSDGGVIMNKPFKNFTNQLLFGKIFPASPTANLDTSKTYFYNNISSFDNTVWYPKWKEENVFFGQIQNKSTANPYTLRIGQGGQMYSIKTRIGEIMPPQNEEHAWIDDTLLMTVYQYDLGLDGPPDQLTGFIHQAGMYPHMDKTYLDTKNYWSPMVALGYDSKKQNELTTVNLGMISCGPAYNRSDVLFYQKNRDLGGGIIEVTYYVYNYNDSYTVKNKDGKPADYLTDFGPWGGIRTSALPDMAVSKQDGTWGISNAAFGPANPPRDSSTTGGWMAAVEDAKTSTSFAYSWVYGQNKAGKSPILMSFGRTDVNRDFTVMAPVIRTPIAPGTGYYYRTYFIMGDFNKVVQLSNQYASKTDYGPLTFPEKTSALIPLYLKTENGQTVISDTGTSPAFHVYAEPVKNSKPLYLIKDLKTGKYKVTCDPYMLMPRYPISGTDKVGYRPYDGSTEIIKIYGYVMPSNKLEGGTGLTYKRLDSVLKDASFYPKTGIYDANIMVR